MTFVTVRPEVREVEMVWWVWPVALIAMVVLLAGATILVQARRRSGTVIAVNRGRARQGGWR
ncbi:hypothetical protein ABZ079_08105 [Streptomyces sp. NPDC006314]|uniref:hypothetical protein n=1 Tax=Streptomyces sp. NPDC006314 TaxID=3154475 RepID=UPI0033B84F86